MTDTFGEDFVKAGPAAPGLFQPAVVDEAIKVLSEALGIDCAVGQETDYEGEVSIVIFPIADVWGTASFILFERDGHPRVAMIRRDVWEWDQGFADLREAVNALIGCNALIGSARAMGTKPVHETSRVRVTTP
jgi:hypothetical protein